jgi:hypothetical protein
MTKYLAFAIIILISLALGSCSNKKENHEFLIEKPTDVGQKYITIKPTSSFPTENTQKTIDVTDAIIDTFTNTQTEKPTITLSDKDYFKISDITKFLLENSDVNDTGKEIWLLYNDVDLNSRIITIPEKSKICFADCATVSWGGSVFITLYRMQNEEKAIEGIKWIIEGLKTSYPYLDVMDPFQLDEILKKFMPRRSGWAAEVHLAEHQHTQYIMSNNGPIIIYIRYKYGCYEMCGMWYPEVNAQLLQLQYEKIDNLLRQ